MIKRFYRDKWYIGVKNTARNAFGDYIKKTEIVTFKGRPYNVYEYDDIIDFDYNYLKNSNLEFRDTSRLVSEPLETLIKRQVKIISI